MEGLAGSRVSARPLLGQSQRCGQLPGLSL